jgi:threonine/homoserine/homoserine lactone efflux protein
MEGWIGFTLAGLALAGSPGPATLSLAATGAAFGSRRGLGYMAGIVVGMLGVIALVASGLTGLALAIPGAGPVVIALSAAYFLYLAYRIATAPPLAGEAVQRTAPSFLAGFTLSLINPKGYAAMAALFAGFEFDFAAQLAILVTIMSAVNLAWLLIGAAMTRLFGDPKTNRIINAVFAVALIASVVGALLI